MTSHGVTLLGDPGLSGGVTFAFTERTGGVSAGCHASLNLGDACGDDPSMVRENRRRALTAIGADGRIDDLVVPRQVHGDRVVVVEPGAVSVRAAQAAAREGADAVVCATPEVPVLLCCADCVLVVLVAPRAFAVVHSGWKGTIARISGKALRSLADVASCSVRDVRCYVGPHICVEDYEVSVELADRFRASFGPQVVAGERMLDLGAAVRATLVGEGVDPDAIATCEDSTASHVDRFYSYRASQGACGRQGAIAMLSHDGVAAPWVQG